MKKGYSHRDIGYALGMNHSSISREVGFNSVNGEYNPRKANHKAYVKRKYSKYQGMKVKENPEIEKYIREKMMNCHWSPEQIAGRLKWETNNRLSVKPDTIYKYLYSVYGQPLCQYLKYKRCRKKKQKQGKSIREIIKNRVFIDRRPDIINKRLRIGDFEGDTLGIPKGTKETIAALIERKSRYILAKKIIQLKYAVDAFKELLRPLNALSLTLDNGVENSRYQELKINTYFCHPYHSWEKGSVENVFGLIREYIPKKKDIALYTNEEISVMVELINNMPRKCLNFRTPKEVFEEHYGPFP